MAWHHRRSRPAAKKGSFAERGRSSDDHGSLANVRAYVELAVCRFGNRIMLSRGQAGPQGRGNMWGTFSRSSLCQTHQPLLRLCCAEFARALIPLAGQGHVWLHAHNG
jgi:hypothetical protein